MPTEKTLFGVLRTFVNDLGEVVQESVPVRRTSDLDHKYVAELQAAISWYADMPFDKAMERYRKRDEDVPPGPEAAG